MNRFPKDCWDKNCGHFHVTDMSVDDLLCACDVLGYECDACDEDYCYLRCPLAKYPAGVPLQEVLDRLKSEAPEFWQAVEDRVEQL